MDTQERIQRYLQEELTSQEFDGLCDWIASDPAHADAFIRFVSDDRVIEQILQRDEFGDLIADFTELDETQQSLSLDRLYEIEARANPDPIDLTDQMLQRQLDARRSARARRSRPTQIDSNRVVVIPKSVFWGSLLAAVLVLAVVLWPEKQPAPQVAIDDPIVEPMPDPVVVEDWVPPEPTPVATLLSESGAVWRGAHLPRVNQALMPGVYELAEGLVRLRFDSEAVTVVEAPAVFTLDSQSQLTLMRGRVATRCDSLRSKGFVVQTPDARITDLGTSFSVEHWAGDRTLTQVMEGQVELRSAAAAPKDAPVKLTVGQAAVVADQSSQVQYVPFEADRATTDWDRLVRRPKIAGDARFALTPPRSLKLGAYENDEQIMVLLERYNVRLKNDLTVSFTEPGRYNQVIAEVRPVIQAGRTVDSYLLHLDAIGESENPVKHSATLAFDRPIIGVIVAGNRLTNSDFALGDPATQYGEDIRPTEQRDARGFDGIDDVLVISDDRKSLSVALQVSNSMDQVRVLVEPLAIE